MRKLAILGVLALGACAMPLKREAVAAVRDGQALRLESVDMTLSPAEAFEDLDEEARSER